MFKKVKGQLVSVARDTKLKAASFGTGAMVAAGSALAGGGGSTFDTTDILAAIAMMLAAGVVIYTAFAVGRWTLRAFGLIGGK